MKTWMSLLVAALTLLGCKRPDVKRIALLLPESKTARYETQDRPLFEKKVKALCPDCEVIYGNANQDAAKQQSQAEAALTNGAKVLVIDAVDGAAARVIAEQAKGAGATVIAYDRMILGTDAVDWFISFEAEAIGKLQARSLLDALAGKPNPAIVMINGAPTDNNALLLKKGAHSLLDGKVQVAKEYDTPDWSPDKAQEQMTQALTALGETRLDAVYAANDGTAGGVIAAFKAAGVPLPIITGQDAEAAAIQRVLAKEQYMTVYKAIRLQAETAAQLAVLTLKGQPVPAAMTNGARLTNGKKEVPSILLEPQAATLANVRDTVFKDGFWTREQICTAAYAEACRAAGL
jgi:D-xylose transport system substrate-binding protein